MALVDLRTDPSPKELRWFGLMFAVFMGLIGGVAWWRLGALDIAETLWSIGGGGALVYYAIPPVRKPFFVAWMVAAFPIGWLISHIVLAIVFYVVLTPIGLVMRLIRKDPMTRRFDPRLASYWEPREADRAKSRYFRQF